MRGSRSILVVFLIALCVACTTHREPITGIDWEAWKADRLGCPARRPTFSALISRQKDQLKAMSEMEVVELMGPPDQIELLKRNQKFYTYFISGGPGCKVTGTDSSSTW